VNGRNALTWEQKFELDIWYVDHVSWRLDFRIVAMTISRSIKGAGIGQNGHETADEFRGELGE
jgi:sugar transferase EpsL